MNDKNWKRFYFQLSIPLEDDLSKYVPKAHITLAEYWIPDYYNYNYNFNNANFINGIIMKDIREYTLKLLNENGIRFEPDGLVKMGGSDHYGVRLKMVAYKEKWSDRFDKLVDNINNHIIDTLRSNQNFNNKNLTTKIIQIPDGTLKRKVEQKIITNDKIFLMNAVYVNNNPLVLIKLYSPAIPHISIAQENLFKRGLDEWKIEKVDIKTNIGQIRTIPKVVGGSKNIDEHAYYKKKYIKYKKKYLQLSNNLQ